MTSTKPTYVLGLNTYDHDVAACLLQDGAVVAAISKERITRRKNAAGFHGVASDYCLSAADITAADLDLIVRASYPAMPSRLERRFRHGEGHQLPKAERAQAFAHPTFEPDPTRTIEISHHLAHAYSAFAPSPFERGAVMVVDGMGSMRSDLTELPCADSNHVDDSDRETESYYTFDQVSLTPVKKVWASTSGHMLGNAFAQLRGLGALYSRVSEYIFDHWNRCGEVMGLAPYGTDRLEPLVWLEDDTLVFRPWGSDLERPFLGGSDAEWQASPHQAHWADLAWRIQHDAEQILLERARRLHHATGEKNLVLAGGVALNCVANGLIARESGFDQIFVQAAAGDDGTALGCAFYGHMKLTNERVAEQKHVFLGRTYDDHDVDPPLRRALTVVARTTTPDDLEATVASLLADGLVVGWFQGGAEFGPRALGHRSILADPRRADMKKRVNQLVKFRQGFRPFAPSILSERVEEWFEDQLSSPFMVIAQHVRAGVQGRIPAVVHTDGTVRAQTVEPEIDPRYHRLLTEFDALTGVPILLNTSFNRRGEPIVETPSDAVRSFLLSGLDALVIGETLHRKRPGNDRTDPLVRSATAIARRVRRAAEALAS